MTTMTRLCGDTRTRIGVAVIVIMVVMAVFAPLVARQDPNAIDLINLLDPPSRAHWLGTDVQGRDVWARLVYGARVSLAVGLVSQTIAVSLGVTLGLLAGYYRGWIDEVVMR